LRAIGTLSRSSCQTVYRVELGLTLIGAAADEIADHEAEPERKNQRSGEIVLHEVFGLLRRLRGILTSVSILAARALADTSRELVHVVAQFF
jgi:hypothetical protein